MEIFKSAKIGRRWWFASFASTMILAVFLLGAGALPGSPVGIAHAAEKEKTFCELHPYDVTCTGATCDIYTEYCPPWPGGATGGGGDSYYVWKIPRNNNIPFASVTCIGSSYEQRKAYVRSAVQAWLPTLPEPYALSPNDFVEITFADGLGYSYHYDVSDSVDPVFGESVSGCSQF